MVDPTATVNTIVTMFIMSLAAVLASRSTMSTSRSMLPSISMVTSGATGGSSRFTTMAMTNGKTIFSRRLIASRGLLKRTDWPL